MLRARKVAAVEDEEEGARASDWATVRETLRANMASERQGGREIGSAVQIGQNGKKKAEPKNAHGTQFNATTPPTRGSGAL